MGLIASIVLNLILVAALLLVVVRAKIRIVEEKVATFSGCLNALTFALGPVEAEQRFERAAVGVGSMLEADARADVKWRLIQASYMRLFRNDPVLADLSEHLRAVVYLNIKGEEAADSVWSYLGPALEGREGFHEEPRTRFSGQELSEGQLQREAPLVLLYRERALKTVPVKLF
ncbi:MAG TPA: hypothetical protein VII73_12905 [Caulobacteraceae bacterium]